MEWRSQPMSRFHLFMQSDVAHPTVDALGAEGLVQFIDLNSEKSAFARRFAARVKACDEMERKVRYFYDQIQKLDVQLPLNAVKVHENDLPPLDDLETEFEDLEKDLRQMAQHQDMLDKNYNELVEMLHVLRKDTQFFSENAVRIREEVEESETANPLLPSSLPADRVVKTGGLGFVTGVIDRTMLNAFDRVVFRSTRGNMFLKSADIEEELIDPTSGNRIRKSVFIIFFAGEKAKLRIKKICDSFHANTYPCPDNLVERDQLRDQVETRLADLRRVLDRTIEHRTSVLREVGVKIEAWYNKIRKEKSVFHTLNLFNYDITRKALMAEGWVCTSDIERVAMLLRVASERAGASVPTVLNIVPSTQTPPTHFNVSKFSRAFQAIVDSYGVARYREVNPAVLTSVTFPFLFAVMFGDIGHGLLLTMFAAFMLGIAKRLEGKQLNTIISMAFSGRYMLLMMGILSIYTGFIYNELLSRPLDLFGSMWTQTGNTFTRIPDAVYPFGIDPAWKDKSNELSFYNSLKMKMSIIYGVTQMTMGTFLKLLNAIHFKKPLDAVFEWVAEFLFMQFTFGYLVIVIYGKWLTDWSTSAVSPPSLINLLIFMFLSPGSVQPSQQMYAGQGTIQLALLAVAFAMIPWILIPKPIIEYLHAKKAWKRKNEQVHSDEEHSDHGHADAPTDVSHVHAEEDERPKFGGMFVHQAIHTIEFALGTVSNTASYLRLWALSLAHSELANVFWEQLLMNMISGTQALDGDTIVSGLKLWAGMAAFFGATMAVLMVMESLSAFLHALRLHWVEFQNRFYHGDGYKFRPFSYARVLAGEED